MARYCPTRWSYPDFHLNVQLCKISNTHESKAEYSACSDIWIIVCSVLLYWMVWGHVTSCQAEIWILPHSLALWDGANRAGSQWSTYHVMLENLGKNAEEDIEEFIGYYGDVHQYFVEASNLIWNSVPMSVIYRLLLYYKRESQKCDLDVCWDDYPAVFPSSEAVNKQRHLRSAMGPQQGRKVFQALMPKETHASCTKSKPTASVGFYRSIQRFLGHFPPPTRLKAVCSNCVPSSRSSCSI